MSEGLTDLDMDTHKYRLIDKLFNLVHEHEERTGNRHFVHELDVLVGSVHLPLF